MTDPVLIEVQNFAAEAHKGQRRKFADEDYINHPIRVSSLCRNVTNSLPVLSAALLHDVLEDTDVSRERLETFLQQFMSAEDSSKTLQLVIDLTDIYTSKAYPRLNRSQRKAKEHERLSQVQPDAQTIKYADIIDNCLDRGEADNDFAPKFVKECHSLLQKIDKGDPQLYRQVKDIVAMEMKKLGVA